MRRMLFALLGGLLVLAVAGRGYAVPVDADPNREFPVTPEVGPWMISVTYFEGPEAAQLAHQMIVELRQQGYPAYLFNRGSEERRKRLQEIEEWHRQHPEAGANAMRLTRIAEQYAVLVGGYKDIDAARDVLERLKKKDVPSEWKKFLPRFSFREFDAEKRTEETKSEMYGNPFRLSFVVHNPTVPVERPKNDKPDPFLKELNADESYSLLKCKSPWTLAVKELRAPSILKETRAPSESMWGKIGLGNKTKDVLNATALQAHEVAKILREHPSLKLEAYVLHTRYSSVVTIGGFDSPNDPRLLQLKRYLMSIQWNSDSGYKPLELFTQPLPMQVPQL